MVSLRRHFVPNPVPFSETRFTPPCKLFLVLHTRYDVQNRLVGKTLDPDGAGEEGTSEEYYAYDGSQILLRFDGPTTNDLVDRYLWAPTVDLLLSDEKLTGPSTPGDIYWALGDNLNTVRDTARYDPQTDTTSIADHRVLDAFGNITSETDPAAGTRVAYTGRDWDPDVGLYYYRARWYDPATGRFLSEDPLGFAGQDTNLQRYVGNSPTNRTDPTGHSGGSGGGGGGSGGSGGGYYDYGGASGGYYDSFGGSSGGAAYGSAIAATVDPWLSEDPIGFEGRDERLCAYVSNAPPAIEDLRTEAIDAVPSINERIGETLVRWETLVQRFCPLIIEVGFIRTSFQNANRANVDRTWWQYLWGGGAAIPPMTAVTIAAIATPEVSGVLNMQRLRDAATGRYAALSPALRLKFSILANVGIYGVILDWARRVAYDVKKVHWTAETSTLLGNLDARLMSLWHDQAASRDEWWHVLDDWERAYKFIATGTVLPGKEDAMKDLIEYLESSGRTIDWVLSGVDKKIAGINKQLDKIDPLLHELEALLFPPK